MCTPVRKHYIINLESATFWWQCHKINIPYIIGVMTTFHSAYCVITTKASLKTVKNIKTLTFKKQDKNKRKLKSLNKMCYYTRTCMISD